jgi:hypothetical protein
MAVYECKVRGSTKTRLVKAATAAQARDHIVDAKPVTAERLGDLMEGGATIEKAGAPAEAKPEGEETSK